MKLGTRYPRSNRPDFSIRNYDPPTCPPRKWRYHSSSVSSTGTLAAPWLGQDILSETYELSDDGQRLTWKINHPTVDDNYIEVSWRLEERPSGSPRYFTVIEQAFYFEGDKYGDNRFQFTDPFSVFLGADSLCCQSSSWQHLLNPAMFSVINQSSFFACQWSFDPAYQPYNRPA